MPYDVTAEAEARTFIGQNPESFLRVTRPEADLDDPTEPAAREKALQNLDSFTKNGSLVSDAVPSVYVYRLTTSTHTQTGVVACCSLDEYENGLIKKHEKTRPDKVTDRTLHMLTLRAQTGLILLAFRDTERIKDLVAETCQTEPLYDFICSGGVGHTVWRADQPAEFADAFREVQALYVADGHHRLESAEKARIELRQSNPEHTGEEDYNYVLAGIFPASELKILAYNRIVHDLNGLDTGSFLERVAENFIVAEVDGDSGPLEHGMFGAYLDGRWHRLRFAVNFVRQPDPIENLDVSILQNYILKPILGIGDPRTDERIGFVGGARGRRELERLVDAGEARVAFELYPTTMSDLLTVSDAGEIMPPKSTWFEPKLKDGLFVHKI